MENRAWRSGLQNPGPVRERRSSDSLTGAFRFRLCIIVLATWNSVVGKSIPGTRYFEAAYDLSSRRERTANGVAKP